MGRGWSGRERVGAREERPETRVGRGGEASETRQVLIETEVDMGGRAGDQTEERKRRRRSRKHMEGNEREP